MTMTTSVDGLLAVARRYWRADDDYYVRGEKSPEAERFEARWKEVMPRMDEWRAMLAELRRDLPGFSIGQITTTIDASFRCSAVPPDEQLRPPHRWVVVGCMSILAPVYTVYGLRYEYRRNQLLKVSNEQLFLDELPAEMRQPAEAMARRMEARFNVSRLPAELAQTPVPLFVEVKAPPHTTLFHALFSSEPYSVP
jgi:hypothetical protein